MFCDELRIPGQRKVQQPDQFPVLFMNVDDFDAEKSPHEIHEGDFRFEAAGGAEERLHPPCLALMHPADHNIHQGLEPRSELGGPIAQLADVDQYRFMNFRDIEGFESLCAETALWGVRVQQYKGIRSGKIDPGQGVGLGAGRGFIGRSQPAVHLVGGGQRIAASWGPTALAAVVAVG